MLHIDRLPTVIPIKCAARLFSSCQNVPQRFSVIPWSVLRLVLSERICGCAVVLNRVVPWSVLRLVLSERFFCRNRHWRLFPFSLSHKKMIVDIKNKPFSTSLSKRLEIILFVFVQKWIVERCLGFAVIAGSYALHTFMTSNGGTNFVDRFDFQPNDIDIYVTVDDIAIILKMLHEFTSVNNGFELA